MTDVCAQRRIREAEAKGDPRPKDECINYKVERIAASEARRFILLYEWLGTMPPIVSACYGARNADGQLAAVAVFGPMSGSPKNMICGPEFADRAICLQRGACAPWAHEHTGSWFTSRATAMAARDYGWRIFYGFSDPEAAEVGIVYQACNWLYLGQTACRKCYRHKSWAPHKWITERVFNKHADRHNGEWEYQTKAPTGKYIWFEGSIGERTRLRRALKQQPMPHPKRFPIEFFLARIEKALEDARQAANKGAGHRTAKPEPERESVI